MALQEVSAEAAEDMAKSRIKAHLGQVSYYFSGFWVTHSVMRTAKQSPIHPWTWQPSLLIF